MNCCLDVDSVKSKHRLLKGNGGRARGDAAFSAFIHTHTSTRKSRAVFIHRAPSSGSNSLHALHTCSLNYIRQDLLSMIYFLQYCGFKHFNNVCLLFIIFLIVIAYPLIDLIYFRLFTFNLSILYDDIKLISYLFAQLLNTFAVLVINSFGNFCLVLHVCSL